MKKLIMLFLLFFSIFILGCSNLIPRYDCGNGNLNCRPGNWIFKTIDINYSEYRLGSTPNNLSGFWSVDSNVLSEQLRSLNQGYYLRSGAPDYAYSPMAFYKKSLVLNESLYPEDKLQKIEIWNELVNNGLVIKQPFTELYICPSINIADPSNPKKSILEKDPNYILDQLNKMIDEGTLSQNCKKKI